MPKMHEILAAEPNVAGAWGAMKDETLRVFDRADAFVRVTTTKKHFAEEDSKLDTTETKDNTTTVAERVSYLLSRSFAKHLDLQLQKDATNQQAKADLVVGGQTLAKDVPAQTLLLLEKELTAIRQVLLKAPTLQSGPVWIRDEGNGLYVTKEPQVTFSTKKTIRPVILVQATEHHPAQVDRVSEDVPVAKIEKVTWSGALSSAEKAAIVGRVDALIVAAKKARQRANNTEASKARIGAAVADFILGGPDTVRDDE